MNLELSPRLPARRRGRRLPAALAALAAFPSILALPSVAHAQQVIEVNQNESQSGYRGPNWMVLSSGLLVFGGMYTGSLIVAGTSSHTGDKALYAPLFGPWIDIANRCPSPTNCDNDAGRIVLLGLDGVFQGLGVLTIASSFLFPPRRGHRMARAESATSFRVLPASYGRGSPGLTAVGTF